MKSCKHNGASVPVGKYRIRAGGTMYTHWEDMEGVDIFVPLTPVPGLAFGNLHGLMNMPPTPAWPITMIERNRRYVVLAAPLPDFGGVPTNWREFLHEDVIPMLENGIQMFAFCAGSHGRTGTFLASLIAILEPGTKDPILAVRERHCYHAVETLAQAHAIFALRRQPLPEKYLHEFTR